MADHTHSTPVPAAPHASMRAFMVFDEIPVGCTVHLEESTRMEPHIWRGEGAVVDLNDRKIDFGEVYLVLNSNGPTLWQIMGVPEKHLVLNPHLADCCWCRPLNNPGPRELDDGTVVWPREMHCSDGPIRQNGLEEKILGKVIGIWQPAYMRRREGGS